MPDVSLTEEQLDRLDAVRSDLGAYVGPYAHVRRRDAVEYLLDTYTPPAGPPEDAAAGTPEHSAGEPDGESEADGQTADSQAEEVEDEDDAEADAPDTPDAGSGGGGSPLQAAAALLEDHHEHWRKSEGEAPYEVDLPDGSTEAVRTKGDVKRLLFKHYR